MTKALSVFVLLLVALLAGIALYVIVEPYTVQRLHTFSQANWAWDLLERKREGWVLEDVREVPGGQPEGKSQVELIFRERKK